MSRGGALSNGVVILREGWLSKRSNKFPYPFQRRYFELVELHPSRSACEVYELHYYVHKAPGERPQGRVMLGNGMGTGVAAEVSRSMLGPAQFVVVSFQLNKSRHRRFVLRAESAQDCEQWVARIQHFLHPRSVRLVINPLHDPPRPLPKLKTPHQRPQQQHLPQAGIMKRMDSGVGIDHLEERSTTPRKAAPQDAHADHSHFEPLQVDIAWDGAPPVPHCSLSLATPPKLKNAVLEVKSNIKVSLQERMTSGREMVARWRGHSERFKRSRRRPGHAFSSAQILQMRSGQPASASASPPTAMSALYLPLDHSAAKTPLVRALLAAHLAAALQPFAVAPRDLQEAVIARVGRLMVQPGQLITAGCHLCDRCYIVSSGCVELAPDNEPQEWTAAPPYRRVPPQDPGASLTCLCPRALLSADYRCEASFYAASQCELWVLERDAFQAVIVEGRRKMFAERLDSLKRVPLLQSLSLQHRVAIADSLTTRTYNDGEVIMHDDDRSKLFVVFDGTVRLVRKDAHGHHAARFCSRSARRGHRRIRSDPLPPALDWPASTSRRADTHAGISAASKTPEARLRPKKEKSHKTAPRLPHSLAPNPRLSPLGPCPFPSLADVQREAGSPAGSSRNKCVLGADTARSVKAPLRPPKPASPSPISTAMQEPPGRKASQHVESLLSTSSPDASWTRISAPALADPQVVGNAINPALFELSGDEYSAAAWCGENKRDGSGLVQLSRDASSQNRNSRSSAAKEEGLPVVCTLFHPKTKEALEGAERAFRGAGSNDTCKRWVIEHQHADPLPGPSSQAPSCVHLGQPSLQAPGSFVAVPTGQNLGRSAGNACKEDALSLETEEESVVTDTGTMIINHGPDELYGQRDMAALAYPGSILTQYQSFSTESQPACSFPIDLDDDSSDDENSNQPTSMLQRVCTHRAALPGPCILPDDETAGLHPRARCSMHEDARKSASPAGSLRQHSPPSSTSDSQDDVYQDACAYAAPTSSGTDEEEEEMLAGKHGQGHDRRHSSPRVSRFQPLQLPPARKSVGKEACRVDARDAGGPGGNAVDASLGGGTEREPDEGHQQGEQGAGLILAQGAVNLMWLDREEFTHLLGPPEQVLAEAQRLRWLESAHLPLLQELTPQERLEMVRAMTTHHFESGDVVISGKHPMDRFVMVEEGEVRVCHANAAGDETVVCLRAGGFLGAETLLGDSARCPAGESWMEATACGRTTTLELRRANVQGLTFSLEEVLAKTSQRQVRDKVEYLRSLWPHYSSLPHSHQTAIAEGMERVHFGEGEVVTQQGAPADGIFIIQSGEAVRKQWPTGTAWPDPRQASACDDGGAQVARLAKAAVFGDWAEAYTSTVQSSSPLLVCFRLSRTKLIQQGVHSAVMETISAFARQSAHQAGLRLEDVAAGQHGGATLGSGTFGRVRLVHDGAGREYALKSMRKSLVEETRQVAHTLSEKQALCDMQHCSFIVRLWATFQDDVRVYMLFELLPGGELYTLLHRHPEGHLPESAVAFYVAQLVLAIQALHAAGYAYRDLKPENVLLDATGYIKLIDLGFAKKMGPSDRTFTYCGTREYLAPEVIAITGHDHSVDWWALGVLTFELLTGETPFCNDHAVLQHKAPPPTTISRSSSARGGAQEGVQFPPDVEVSKSARDFVNRLLHPVPHLRLGCSSDRGTSIKNHPFFEHIDWDALQQRTIVPPYRPDTTNCLSNFITEDFDSSDSEEDVPVPSTQDSWFVGF